MFTTKWDGILLDKSLCSKVHILAFNKETCQEKTCQYKLACVNSAKQYENLMMHTVLGCVKLIK